MMDLPTFSAWMDRHATRAAFRLETLQAYEVASDGGDFRRYLDGEPTWTSDRKQPWLDRLADERAHGFYRHRVRIVTHPVTDYTKYEAEWGYGPNVDAGEDVRILDLGEREIPNGVELATSDWWLVTDDDRQVRAALMRYADDGQFAGAVEVAEPLLLTALVEDRDRLWATAEPFTSWWARHPELHRDTARVS